MSAYTHNKSTSDNSNLAIVDRAVKTAQMDSLFGQLIGGADAPIYRVRDLEKKGSGAIIKGINIDTYEPKPGVSMPGTGNPLTAEGTGEKLQWGNYSLELLWHEVEIKMGHIFQKQYTKIDLMRLKSNRISRWMRSLIDGGYDGRDAAGNAQSMGFDYGLINQLLESSPAYLYVDPTHDHATGGAGNLVAGDYLTLDSIVNFADAMETGMYSGTNQSSVSFRKRAKANALNQYDQYFLIAHPLLYTKLRQSTDFKDLAISFKSPYKVGKNPVWNRYISTYGVVEHSGVTLLKSNRMPIWSNGGAGGAVWYGKFLLLGASAGLHGKGMNLPFKEGWDKPGDMLDIYPKAILGNAQAVPDDDNEASGMLIGLATLE